MTAASFTLKQALRQATADRAITLTIIVSALGYFVDIFDLLLFSIVRVPSLKELQVPNDQLLDVGVRLLNIQMTGLLLGGLVWGVLGDKFGRVSVLLGSILLYSLGNIGNGFVQTVDQYAVLRFITGLGLAGELGCGVTLASELLPRQSRGLGATFIAFVGITGAGLATYIAHTMGWRAAYIIGGLLGIGLLILRVKVSESGLYGKTASRQKRSSRGNLALFFKQPELLRKYILVVLAGAPIWASVGVFITFSREFAESFGMKNLPDPGTAVLSCYLVQAVAGLFFGLLSQHLRSRKKAIFIALMVMIAATIAYVTVRTDSLLVFYLLCCGLGVGGGYWAMFVQTGAEQFGTNIRATAATSIPNMVRGLTIPMTWAFKHMIPTLGHGMSGIVVMGTAVTLSLFSLWQLRETFHVDLDYVEGAA